MVKGIVGNIKLAFNSASDFLFFKKYPNFSTAYPRLTSTGDKVIIPDLKLVVDKARFPDVGRLAGELREIDEKGVKLTSKDGEIIGNWNGVSFSIEDRCNIITVKEIFIEELYKFKLDKKVVVIDIGMNVGLASLYLASLDGVAHVYGYEPFEFTFEKAKKNLGMNPRMAGMITPVMEGISGSSYQLDTTFNKKDHTSMGTLGVVEEHHADSAFDENVSIRLVDVEDVISKVRAAHPGMEILVKMDCEGSEYDIMDRLEGTGSIKAPVHYMIEWHVMKKEHDPQRIISALEKNGYFINQSKKSEKIGMIYATRVS
ncbi:MAG: hypothetical protein A4E32_01239 [Methanomassiliicoccales archaeon PtaU1.Bin124]|nr:MAG: hypothetical protein A4E32_01239 [Methanomassiliicoccales archaeon PtaU1.Bin124]